MRQSLCAAALRTAFRSSRLAREEHGGAMVEMAYTLPVLLLVVTGLYTFGITINNFMVLVNGTDVAARQLAISRGQTTDPCATAVSTFYASAPTLAQSSLAFTFVLNGATYTGTSCSSSSTTTGAAGNLVQGASAEVHITYPCTLKVYGANLAPNCSMTGVTTELVQ